MTRNKSQFSLQHVGRNSNLFTINPTNPQQLLIKGSAMIFQYGNTYDLNNPDLSYFLTNRPIDGKMENFSFIFNFSNDMKSNLKYGQKKSKRYSLIKHLFSYQKGSELKFIFLSFDPDELIDQFDMLYLK